MLDIEKDNRVLSLGNQPGLKQTLSTLLDQLGRCQKALNEFLEVCIFMTVSKACLNSMHFTGYCVNLGKGLPPFITQYILHAGKLGI